MVRAFRIIFLAGEDRCGVFVFALSPSRGAARTGCEVYEKRSGNLMVANDELFISTNRTPGNNQPSCGFNGMPPVEYAFGIVLELKRAKVLLCHQHAQVARVAT